MVAGRRPAALALGIVFGRLQQVGESRTRPRTTTFWRVVGVIGACLGLVALSVSPAQAQAHPPTPITEPDGSPVPTDGTLPAADDGAGPGSTSTTAPDDQPGAGDQPSAADSGPTWPDPPPSDLDELGQLLAARRGAGPAVKPPDFFAGATADTTKPSGPPYKTGPAEGSPVVTPPPALPPGDGTIYAVGDSVLLGTERYLPTTVAGWDLRLDGRVGRRFPEGISIIQANRASLGQVAVVLLGHNDGRADWNGYVDAVMAEMRNVQRVVFVTVTEWTPNQADANRAFYEGAKRYKNIVVAPWAETVKANPDFLRDNVHPTVAGAIALSNLIAVMIGPVPARNGVVPPRPVILPLPPDSGSTTRTTTSPTTTPPTTRPPVTSPPTTSRPPVTLPPTTATTRPSTTLPPPTTATTAPTTSTAPPPTTPAGAGP